jgi:hypothetical protein
MIATITATQTVQNLDRHQLGGYRTKLFKGATLLQTAERPDAVAVNFQVTATPGTYIASAQRLSNLGSPIGPEVMSEPLIVGGPETFEAPLTITLSL